MSCGDEIDRGFRGNSSLQAVCGANASIARTSYDFRDFIYSFGEENTQYFLCKCKGTYIYTVAFQNMLLFLLGPPAVVVEIWRFACDEASAFSGGRWWSTHVIVSFSPARSCCQKYQAHRLTSETLSIENFPKKDISDVCVQLLSKELAENKKSSFQMLPP